MNGAMSDPRDGSPATAEQAGALARTAGVMRLLDEALGIRGDDARAWLNGQVTNDVRHTAPGDAVYALIVSLSGKVLSDLWVLDRGDDGFVLLFPRGRRAPMREYLDRFVIMEDVEMDDLDVAVLTAQGPRASEVLPDGFPCNRLGETGRDVLVAPADAAITLTRAVEAARLAGGCQVSAEGWELARVRQRVPRYGLDFGENTLPQEAGLKQRAVSFDKGCYQGQEAVVMLEHRGRPPKVLVALDIEGDGPPAPETPIDRDGSTVGRITTALADPEHPGHARALGYLKRAHTEGSPELRVAGRPARIEALLGG